ncbi:membrane hypothetical protein [Magnetospirillum sp. LM-5]|uniref:hypothetical protein n=1 Tax=Magnetospirillum sp. LM-5 TaxID=2681466 RepID=UPI001382CC83|nr:hypothetical protein [Magnetospirillum sp. LM-5]CAA7612686.1 membrane hypothetical protein [Magnetospirillum sp. LM-5]
MAMSGRSVLARCPRYWAERAVLVVSCGALLWGILFVTDGNAKTRVVIAAAGVAFVVATMMVMRGLPRRVTAASLAIGIGLALAVSYVGDYRHHRKLALWKQVFEESLPGAVQSELADRNTILTFRAPSALDMLLSGIDKSTLHDFADVVAAANKFHDRVAPEFRRQRLSDEQARVASLMMFTSGLWGYGNVAAPDKPGCVGTNERKTITGRALTFQDYLESDIGCCTDYAYLLHALLDAAGFTNRLSSIPGHIFNEVQIRGRWHTVDANINVVTDHAWNDVGPQTPLEIMIFPHPGLTPGRLYRRSLLPFRVSQIVRMAAGLVEEASHPAEPPLFLSVSAGAEPAPGTVN